MNRREFSVRVLCSLGLAGMVRLAQAESGDPVEGTNFNRLSQAQPVTAGPGKIEVVEFFWYGCPHCNHLEPTLEAWVAKLPTNVVFRRVPVILHEHPGAIHQQLFYAIETMGLPASLHGKVFNAIHNEHNMLDTPEAIQAFMGAQGVDGNRFMAVFNSFAVQTKCRQGRATVDAYRIEGVPTLAVGGKYTTSVALNGTSEKTLQTVDYLINRVRKGQ